MSNAALYSGNLAPFNNAGANSVDSLYAQIYGQATTDQLVKDLRPVIFDSAPQGFYDLALINRKPSYQVRSQQHYWNEKGYGRDGFLATTAVAGGGNSITIPVSAASLNVVTTNTLVGFPNGQKGTVSAINRSLNTITITMQTGQVAPNVNNGDMINNVSSVEADGVSTISQSGFRINLIERYNFIQILAKGTTWGTREMEEWVRNGTTNYIQMNQQEMMRQYRNDISNILWMGVKGQVQLGADVAKTADGIYASMQNAGSPILSTTQATLGAAIEAAALQTEYETVGNNYKYLFATPTVCHNISQYYKNSNTIRYNFTEGSMSNGQAVDNQLTTINIGSTYIKLVPFKRFDDYNSFPSAWQGYAFLLDLNNIEPCYFMEEYMITTPDRRSGINLNTFNGTFMNGDFSIRMFNPLSSALIITH